MYIDTHVHLNAEELYKDLDHYIEKARNMNVKQMIVIGFDKKTNKRAIEIAEAYPFIYASVGFHPTIATEITKEDYEQLDTYLSHDKVVAIGECGLDFYWDKDHQKEQLDTFEKQIKRAKKHDLPLVIHMRDASEATYKMLKKHAPLRGVMHCYSGSVEMVNMFLELGLHISLGGPVTFKNAKTPKEVARMVPLDKLLIETDAPYLTPHPYRGKQNDSSYLPLIAKAIASLKNIDVEQLAQTTSNNAINLFDIKEDNPL